MNLRSINSKVRQNKTLSFIIIVALVAFFLIPASPLSIIPDAVITPLNYVTTSDLSDTQLAKETRATIKCKETEEVYTPQYTLNSGSKAFVVPNGYEARMTISRSCGGTGEPESYVVYKGSEDGTQIYDCNQPSCSLNLEANNVYYVKEERRGGWSLYQDCEAGITLNWKKQELVYSDPFGRDEIPIPGTDYCVDQRGVNGLAEKASEEISAAPTKAESVSTVYAGTDGSQSLGYTHGHGFTEVLDVLQPLANIIKNKVSIGGVDYVATCDQVQRKVYLYKKIRSYDGQSYGVPGRAIIDGSSWNELFCCSTSYCLSTYGSGWSCVDQKCVESSSSTDTCFDDADCTLDNPYFADSDGSYEKVGECIGGQCEYSDREIECVPGKTYFADDGGELCCNMIDGEWKLGACKTIPKNCPAGACCLEGNEYSYTVHLAPPSMECCDFDGDGVGQIAENCDDLNNGGGSGIDIGPLEGLSDMLGGGLIGDILVIMVIAFLLLIIILIITR